MVYHLLCSSVDMTSVGDKLFTQGSKHSCVEHDVEEETSDPTRNEQEVEVHSVPG